jgi:hypothetical protein
MLSVDDPILLTKFEDDLQYSMHNVRFEAFTATKCNKTLLGRQFPEDKDRDGSRNVGFISF